MTDKKAILVTRARPVGGFRAEGGEAHGFGSGAPKEDDGDVRALQPWMKTF